MSFTQNSKKNINHNFKLDLSKCVFGYVDTPATEQSEIIDLEDIQIEEAPSHREDLINKKEPVQEFSQIMDETRRRVSFTQMMLSNYASIAIIFGYKFIPQIQ